LKSRELLLVSAFLIVIVAFVSIQISGLYKVVIYEKAEYIPSGILAITYSGWPLAWRVDYSYDMYFPLLLNGYVMDVIFYTVIYSVITALIFEIYHFRVNDRIQWKQ